MRQEWCPQHTGNTRNLSSLAYHYRLSPVKRFDGTFRTHLDILSKIRPRFSSGDWTQLANGGSRDHWIEKWLSISDTAKLWCHPVGCDPAFRGCRKGGVVLAEALPDGMWEISVPYSGDPIGEAEDDTDSIAETGDHAA